MCPAYSGNSLKLAETFISELIFNWINTNLQYAIYLIPLFAFAEACIGIGLFVSGVFLVAIASLVLDQQLASIGAISVLAFLGAVAGDHAGYYVGRFIGPHFHHSSFVERRKNSFARAENMIIRYGPLAVFIGRFIPAIRSIIPALLGITGFARLKYSLLDATACALWSIALGAIVFGIDNLI